ETPPSISLFVFTNSDDAVATGTVAVTPVATDTAVEAAAEPSRLDKIRIWAQENQNLTSIHLAQGEPQEVEIDGLNGRSYTADGLYMQDIYLFSYRDRMYMFVGQYMGEDDPLRGHFQDVLGTIHFD